MAGAGSNNLILDTLSFFFTVTHSLSRSFFYYQRWRRDMTKRFQHQLLFISSTCLLWGLFLLSLKFSCAENWRWQPGGGGGGFPSAGGSE